VKNRETPVSREAKLL